jgi:uncharacterized membrane protein YeaQ/YmgE (transglycosylase-associated protein family)
VLLPAKDANTMAKILGLIVFLMVGLAAGAIASYTLGRQQDPLANLIIGIIGAMVGGFIATLLGLTAFNVIGEVVAAAAVAVLCLYVWQQLRRK